MTINGITGIDIRSVVMAKPGVLLKEEDDKWGILYDPDTDLSFTINPVGIFIWKQLKTPSTAKHLLSKVKETFTNVPLEVEADVIDLIKHLQEKNLVSLETQ